MRWNSQQIPELAGLNYAKRMQVLRKASDLLPTPAKLALNLLKLVVLVPFFMAIARSGFTIEAAFYAVALILLYPLVTRPVSFYLLQAYLTKARQLLDL